MCSGIFCPYCGPATVHHTPQNCTVQSKLLLHAPIDTPHATIESPHAPIEAPHATIKAEGPQVKQAPQEDNISLSDLAVDISDDSLSTSTEHSLKSVHSTSTDLSMTTEHSTSTDLSMTTEHSTSTGYTSSTDSQARRERWSPMSFASYENQIV